MRDGFGLFEIAQAFVAEDITSQFVDQLAHFS